MSDRGHALRWTCPECGTHLRTEAAHLDAARGALVSVIREHLDAIHDAADVNHVAQASWLAAAGHLVELWGGPHDGDYVWCPPGELPRVVGVHRDEDGTLTPIRSATARLMPDVDTYVLGIDGTGSTAADRYVWTP